ncbi:MAG: hypothetical protein LBU39_03810 [Desulfobulbaceae bacterium]|jgi:TolB-like protein|nr:hypothetical protein [Desulfobulbaceae bacterium]
MKSVTQVVFAICALLLGGCGHTVVETLRVPQTPTVDAAGNGKTVVVLPFADYSQGDSVASAERRSMMITESITDKLSANGFSLPVQEDVFEYLVAEHVINPVSYTGSASTSLNYELTGDWSNTMKKEISGYLETEKRDSMAAAGAPGAHGLTAATIAKIGREFGADYVVRGRILEFKTRDEGTWEPWKRGVIPFIMRGSNRILFGYADSAEYDEDNASLAGMMVGARVGYETLHWPNDEFMGIGASNDTDAAIWGAAGYGLGGRSAGHAGYIGQASVQMRIWVQEASTGNVIWTNRVSVKVSPESFFADNQYDVLFNQAINQCVNSLIDNFITTGL